MPAEIRNRIYEEVFVEEPHDIFVVGPTRFMQPAIVRTSKTIRADCLKLFYNSYHFEVEIQDYNFGPHPKHWVWKSRRHYPYIMLSGRVATSSWSNFLEWLHMFWQDVSMPRVIDQGDGCGHEITCAAAFDIVESLAKAGTPWEAVMTVLNSFKVGVQANWRGEWMER